MARKRVTHYAEFQNVGGAISINVYYEGGGADTIDGLSVAEAAYIIDILRNEKPVDYDHARRRFMSGTVEPVGEGEGGPLSPLFNLNDWILARPAIANAIVWQDPGGATRRYADWTAAEKSQLNAMYMRIVSGRAPGLAAAPAMVSTPGDAESAETRLSRDDAWRCFIAHVAQSLVVEFNRLVNWPLSDFNAEELSFLFGSRSLFDWNAGRGAYTIAFSHGVATPGDPYRTYQFLLENRLLAATRPATVANVLQWVRLNLIHFLGGWDSLNVFNQWQYRGFPPVERMIAGTPDSTRPADGVRKRTGGCWGTTGFLRCVLRTVNIPVKLAQGGGHAIPQFMNPERYLSHGDDPYNRLFKTEAAIPASRLLINRTQFDNWFGPGVAEPVKNVGRQVRELALEFLPTYLLKRYCEDLAAGRTHAAGEVFETFQNNYTVAQLEALNLWTRMDAKIAALGGCAAIPDG